MTDDRDIERLMAYADGELAPAEAAEVERRLEADAGARRLVALFMQQPALLRTAFADRVQPAASQPVEPKPANGNRPGWRAFYRAAAAVVLLLGGVAAGWVGAEMRIRAEEGSRASTMAAAFKAQQAALNVALEQNSNGEAGQWASDNGLVHGTITPLMTFVDDQGSFCREVEQDFTVGARSRTAYGLACRVGEGQWQVRYWLFENPEELPGMTL